MLAPSSSIWLHIKYNVQILNSYKTKKKKKYILVIVNSYHLQAHEQDGESNPLWVGYGDLASINSSMKQTSWKIARHQTLLTNPIMMFQIFNENALQSGGLFQWTGFC